MVNKRYFLVILDPAGRSVRRLGVSRKLLQSAAAAALLLVLGAIALLGHGMARARTAAETDEIEQENQILREAASQIEARLMAGRMLGLRAELTFAQLWAKSGLGREPDVLGIGPLEQQAEPSPETESLFGARQNASPMASAEPAALPLELDRLESEGQALQTGLGEMLEYFHDAALLLSNTPSVRPLVSGYFSSSFGKRRDPLTKTWVMHKGLDIAGQIGTDVLAPADGVVIFTGMRGSYGLTLVVDHGYGLQTHYAHLSRIRVKRGDRVQRGDLIAAVGNTGRSTGPHLHYEVRRNGQPLNPMRFILD